MFFKRGTVNFHFLKYEKIISEWFFYFFYFASSESSLIKFPFLKKFQFQKYNKSFFWENIRTFFILVPESSISQNKRKMLFPENIRNFVRVGFLIFEFGLKSTPGSPIYTTVVVKLGKVILLILQEL